MNYTAVAERCLNEILEKNRQPSAHYVGIAILTARNGLAYTRECLNSLQAQTNQPLLILVADNASSDGTASWLRSVQQSCPNVMRITFPEVVSVAAMWNEALRSAWAMGFGEALVVNNDTELLPNAQAELHKARYRYGYSMVTCVSRRPGESLAFEKPFSVRDNPDFSCFLLSRYAWEQVGGFDESYLRAYGEDCEMHVRLHRKGFRAVSIGLPFLHVGAGTLKISSLQEIAAVRRQADLNRDYFFRKWGRRIGTKGYEDLFTAETFGIDATATSAVAASASVETAEDPSAPAC